MRRYVPTEEDTDDTGQPIPDGVESEAEGYAMEFVYQVIPALEPRDNAAVLLTAPQLEILLRRMGWMPPSERRE